MKGEPNNFPYKDVTIDRSRFDSFPEDDYLDLPMSVDFSDKDNCNSDNECENKKIILKYLILDRMMK